MTVTLIGYARCSTDKQDLAAQKAALTDLGVPSDRIYTDHGLTGTNRLRPGLDQALAAVRMGDTLVVPKLDRLARSVPDARFIADALVARGVRLALGSSVYDPVDSMGKMFFNILATFAEFEADLIRLRTREGMAIARSRGKLRGKQPKLSDKQQKELRRMHDTGDYSISDLAELFSISRPTVYRTLARLVSTLAVNAACISRIDKTLQTLLRWAASLQKPDAAHLSSIAKRFADRDLHRRVDSIFAVQPVLFPQPERRLCHEARRVSLVRLRSVDEKGMA